MPRRSPLRAFAHHARHVTARRLRHGPRLPGWEWSHEVFQEVMRDAFLRSGKAAPQRIRQRMEDAARLDPSRFTVRLVDGQPGGVPATMVVPPRPSDRFILYLHGGGYVFGSPRSHMPLLAPLARAARSRVIALDYRLAPEHPCPAAIDDVVAAYRGLLERGVDPQRVVFMGDSAGGGLVLTSLLALRDADLPLPARAALLSPWTDLTVSGETPHTAHEHDYLGDGARLRDFASHYAGGLDSRDPRLSPLFAPDLSGLPPMLVLAGGVESILDDSTRLADRLRDARVPVDLHVEPYEVHVYPMFSATSRRARDGVRRLAAWTHASG